AAARPGGAVGGDAVLEDAGQPSPAEKAALPPAAFVETFSEALQLAERHPGTTFVARTREVVRGPVLRVAGPAAEASGLYSLRREEQTLGARRGETQEALAAAVHRGEEAKDARDSAESALPALRDR